MLHCNYELADYLKELIGSEFMEDATNLEKLLAYENDEKVLQRLREIKKDAKVEIEEVLEEDTEY